MFVSVDGSVGDAWVYRYIDIFSKVEILKDGNIDKG